MPVVVGRGEEASGRGEWARFWLYIWGIEATLSGELGLTMLHSVTVCYHIVPCVAFCFHGYIAQQKKRTKIVATRHDFLAQNVPKMLLRLLGELTAIWPSLQWKTNTNSCALYQMLSFLMTLDDLHIHHCNIGLVNAVLTQVVSSFVLEVYVFIRAV